MPRVRDALLTALTLAAVVSTVSWLRAADEPAATATVARTSDRGRGNQALLRLEEVQKDLGLSTEQVDQVKKVHDEHSKSVKAIHEQLAKLGEKDRKAKLGELPALFERLRKESADKLHAILSVEQRKRLHQIYLQVHESAALNYKDVADELQLTDEQRRKLMEIREGTVKSLREVAGEAKPGGEASALSKRISAIQKDAFDKAIEVLTSQQREQFEKMQGKKLDINRSRLGFAAAG